MNYFRGFIRYATPVVVARHAAVLVCCCGLTLQAQRDEVGKPTSYYSPTPSGAHFSGILLPMTPLSSRIITLPGATEFARARLYYYGDSLHGKDLETARKLFLKSAKLGFFPAQRDYAIMAYNGEGGLRDPVASSVWMKKAAEQGDAGAALYYGNFCLAGLEGHKDKAAAGNWWRKAAEQNLPEAQHNLALLFLQGDGVAQDDAAGLSWLQRAAQGGYALSQLYLGMIYMKGTDKKSAYYWLRRAAEQKNPDAVKLLAELEPQITPEIKAAVERELKPATAESAAKPEH